MPTETGELAPEPMETGEVEYVEIDLCPVIASESGLAGSDDNDQPVDGAGTEAAMAVGPPGDVPGLSLIDSDDRFDDAREHTDGGSARTQNTYHFSQASESQTQKLSEDRPLNAQVSAGVGSFALNRADQLQALGLVISGILAGAFLSYRRRQGLGRPLGTKLPVLSSRGRSLSMALASAAGDAICRSSEESTSSKSETEISLGVRSNNPCQGPEPDDSAESICKMPSPPPACIRVEAENMRVLSNSTAADESDHPVSTPAGTGDNEFWCDIEAEQVIWLAGDQHVAHAAATAMALQLIGKPTTQLIVAGSCFQWLAVLDEPRFDVYADAEEAWRVCDDLVAGRKANRSESEPLTELRADCLVSDAWSPVVLVADLPPRTMPSKLAGLGVSMILCSATQPPTAGVQVIRMNDQLAEYVSTGEFFVPYQVDAPAKRVINEIFEVAASSDYPPAPWWAIAETTSQPIVLPTIMRLQYEEGGTVPDMPEHPIVRILGTIELCGAKGHRPSRAIKQCIEYCAWLLENPGGTALTMADDLMVAETTRRSNMSRLRTWLGHDSQGRPYLPDAYSGRIALHPGICSDWEQLQMLIGGGVNRVANASLVRALELVRGEPLADAAPGQWYWAEQLRHDIVAMITDIALVLARRSIQADDLHLAQWAVDRALLAVAENEYLAAAQIELAHLRGNDALAGQLIMELTRRARTMGMDLADETVALLQHVAEGRTRFRGA